MSNSTTPVDSAGKRPASRAIPVEQIALYSALLLVACLGLAAVFRLLGIRFTIWDDAYVALVANKDGGMRALLQGYCMAQGRIQFLLGTPLTAWPLTFEQSAWFDILHYGGLLLAHLAFVIVLRLYVSLRFSLSVALIYISSRALLWEHDLLVAVPVYIFGIILSGLVSLILLYAYKRTGRRSLFYCSLGALAISYLGHEYQPVLSLAAYIIAVYRLEETLPSWHGAPNPAIRQTLFGAGCLFILYGLAFGIFRVVFPSGYDGNSISVANLHIRSFFTVLFRFSFASSVVPYLLRPYEFPYWDQVGQSRFSYTTALPVADMFRLSNWPHFAVMMIVVVAGALLVWRAERISKRAVLVIGGMGLLVMFLPNALLAVTPKYRQWVESGVRAYAYSTISHFGFALALASLYEGLSLFLARFRGGLLCWRCLAIGILASGSFVASYSNALVAGAMKVNGDRWNAFNLLMASPAMSKEIEHKILIAPRLWSYFWNGIPVDSYWQEYANAKYRKDVDFRKQVSSGAQNGLVLFDYVRQDKCGGLFDIVAPTSVSAAGAWRGSALYLIAAHDPLNAFVGFRTGTGAARYVAIANTTRLGKQGYIYSIATPDLDPGSIRVDCVPENRVVFQEQTYTFGEMLNFGQHDVDALLGAGWSHVESFGRWTDGAEAEMRIPFAETPVADLIFTVVGWPFLAPGHPSAEVEVLANDHPVATWRLSRPGVAEQTTRIPAEVFAGGRILRLKLHVLEPISPAALGVSADPRRLGMAVETMRFTSPKVYRTGEVLDFRPGGNAAPFLGPGWSGEEGFGRWTDGSEANIQLPFNSPPSSYLTLAVITRPFLAGTQKQLNVDVIANQQTVATWHLTNAARLQEQLVRIPEKVFHGKGLLLLQFRIANPASPASVGISADPRKLGIAVESVRLYTGG